jgi:hypothetical protein
MAHRLEDEAGVTRALAIGIRMTPAELAKGRFMRAPDGHDAPISRSEQMDAVGDFIADEFLGGKDEPEEEEGNTDSADDGDTSDDDNTDDDDQSDSDDDQDDGTDEAVKPIDPPVSWDKDAKELFAQLPPELQSKVAEREAQRDKAIQSATTEAANARRNAVAEANAAFAEEQRKYASHLEQVVGQFAPQPPDPAIAAQDPGRYIALKAQYDSDSAQYQQWMQHIGQTRDEAGQRDAITRQHELAQDQEVLTAKLGDDWTDMSRRKELLTNLETIGAELGYPTDLMGQANATDILALKAASEWKAKAEKYDQLQMNHKMAGVRAAKEAPRVSKPGTSQTGAERSARGRQSAWEAVKKSPKSGDASAAYLESIGITL